MKEEIEKEISKLNLTEIESKWLLATIEVFILERESEVLKKILDTLKPIQ